MTSREDLYLKKLNDSSVVTPQPVTQREKILSELAGVNGLGVELPTVTDTDNGKALVVDNGQWALGNASGGSGGAKNIVDGSANGSVRTVDSTEEDENYTIGYCAFSSGASTKAGGMFSHAEGYETTASGEYSHAEGYETTASGGYSHAEGFNTIAYSSYQHVQGQFNIQDENGDYAFIIGNGTNAGARSNALGIKWDGTFALANGTEITPAEFTQMKSGGSGGSGGSLNIIVNMTPQGQAQSGEPIYTFTTDTKWSELLDAYRNDLEIRLTAKQPIDENSNDTNNIVARFAWFMPSDNGSTPSSDIDKGTFYFKK